MPPGAFAGLRAAAAATPDVDAQKARLDAALSKLTEAVKATEADTVERADFDAADAAVKEVDAALEAGEALAESDEGYRRYAGDARAQFAITKARLRKTKKAFVVVLATRRIAAAEAKLTEAGEAAEADGAGEGQLSALRAAADALVAAVQAEAELSAKDAGLRKVGEAAKAAAAKAKARADQRAVELAVAAHRAKVEGALADVTGRIEALSEAAAPSAYEAAQKAVARLDAVIAEGAALSKQDAEHAAYLAGLRAAQPDRRAQIAEARLSVAEAAVKAAADGLTEASEADVQAAKQSLDRLEGLVEDAAPLAKAHAGHRKFVGALRGRLGGYARAIEARWVALGVAAHEGDLDAAVAEVDAALAGLEGAPSPADLSKADAATAKLAEVLEGGAALAKKDPKYAAKLAGIARELPSKRATVVRRRIEVLAAGLDAQFQALPEPPSEDDLSPIEAVLTSVEAAVAEGRTLARADRALAQSLRSVQAGLRSRRAELNTKALAARIRPHRAKVEAANQEVEAALGALEGTSEHERYVAAEEAVAALKKVVEAGAELGAQDRAYGAFLGRFEAQHADRRALIRQRRIEAAEGAAKEALAALEGTPGPAEFAAAEKAVERVATVTDSNRGFEHRGFSAFVRGVDARLKGYRGAIARRRVEVKVEAEGAKLEAALAEAKAAVEALASGTPGPAEFAAAERAVQGAEKALEGAKAAAEKDRGLAAKRAAGARAVAAQTRTIASRRVEVEVAAARATVEETAAAAKAAVDGLAGAPAPSAFEAADSAIAAYEAAVEASAKTAKKDRAFAAHLGAARQTAAEHRGAVARRRLEVAVAAADAAMGGLGEAPDGEVLASAELLVGRLERAIQGAPEAKDRRLSGTLTGARRTAKGHRARLAALSLELKLAPERAKLEAATEEVTSRISGLEQAPKPSDFAAAESSVSKLAALTEAGAGLASESPAFARRLEAAKRAVPRYRAQIATRRAEVVVAAFFANVEEAKAAADAALEAALAEPGPATFAKLDVAAEAWAEALAQGERLAAKDRGVARRIAASSRALAALRGKGEARRTRLRIDGHRAQVEAAQAKVQQALQKLGPEAKHEDYQAAENEIAALSKVVDAGDELAASDRAYARFLASVREDKPAQRALIRQRRIEVAAEAAKASIGALEGTPDAAAFRDAERSVSRLEKVTDANAGFSKQHRPFARFVGQIRQRILAQRAAIDRARLRAAQAGLRARIEARRSAVKEALEAVEAEPGPASFARAERAVEALEQEVKEDPPEDVRSRALMRDLRELRKAAGGHRRTIAAARVGLEVRGHRARVDEALARSDAALSALDAEAPAEAAFGAAKDAVAALEAVLEEGERVAKKDGGHARFLAGLRKGLSGRRAKIEARRVALARARMQERLTSVDDTERAEDLAAAERAVEALEGLGGGGRETTAARAKIEARRFALESAPHQAALAAAKEALGDRVAHLADAPKPADFEKASEALAAFEKVIEDGAPLAAKRKTYARALADEKKAAAGFSRRIEARRTEVIVEGWRASVAEAKAEIQAKLDGLTENAGPGDFASVEADIEGFEAALGRSEKLAAKSRAVRKALAGHLEAAAGYRRRLAERRAALKIAAHREEVLEAKAKVKARLEALGAEAKHEDYQATEEAIYALKQVVEAGLELGAVDRIYGRELSGLLEQHTALRAVVRKKRVLAAEAEARARIDGLAAEASTADYAEAYQAVARLETTVQSNASFGEKDRGYRAFSAKMAKRPAALRAAIDRRRVDLAKAELEQRLEAIEVTPSAEAFAKAEDALREYGQVVGAGSSKALRRLRRELPGLRARLERRRIEVARAAAEAQVAALDEAEDTSAFDAATGALDRLEARLGEAARVEGGGRALAKTVKAERRRATTLRERVERARAAFVVRPHRERVQAALSSAEEAVSALGPRADPEAFSTAESAIEALEVEIGKGERLRRESKAHARFMDRSSKTAARLTRAVRARRADVRVRAHRAELEVAEAAVKEALSTLTRADRPDFDGAAGAVEAYQAKLAEGAELAGRDRGHRRYLEASRRQIPEWKARIALVKVEAAEASAQARLSQVRSEPTPDAFVAAHEAARALKAAVKDARDAAKRDRRAKRRLKKVTQLSRALPGRIEAARIEAARDVVQRQMAALRGDVDAAAVEAAEEALENLDKALDVARARGRSSKAVKRAVKTARRAMKKDRQKIAKARREATLGPVREGLAEAAAEAASTMSGLSDQPTDEAVAEAASAVAKLGAVVDQATPHANKSKSLRKMVRKQRRLHSRYERDLVRARMAGQLAEHRAKVEAARDALEAQVAKLDADAAHEDYQAAMVAVSDLGKVLAEGDALAAVDRRYARFLRRVDAQRAGYPRRIRQRRIEAALKVAERRVEALGRAPGEAEVAAAHEAIDRVQTVMDSNAKNERGKGFRRFVAATKKDLWRLRVEASRVVTAAALAGLEAESAPDDFRSAEQAVATQAEMLKSGKRLAKRDRKLKRVYSSVKKEVRRNRGTIAVRRLEAALVSAAARVDALREDTSSAAIYDAEHAIDRLGDMIRASKKLAKKSRLLKKKRRIAQRKAKAYKRMVKRVKRGGSVDKKRRRRGRRS